MVILKSLQEIEKTGNQKLSNLAAELCVLREKLQQVDVLGIRLPGQLRGGRPGSTPDRRDRSVSI